MHGSPEFTGWDLNSKNKTVEYFPFEKYH